MVKIVDKLKNRETYVESSEVVQLLGICKMTLSRWVRKGMLKAVRIGNENKFDPAVLIAYLEAHET
jgi:excisionase family DNA binding protein